MSLISQTKALSAFEPCGCRRRVPFGGVSSLRKRVAIARHSVNLTSTAMTDAAGLGIGRSQYLGGRWCACAGSGRAPRPEIVGKVAVLRCLGSDQLYQARTASRAVEQTWHAAVHAHDPRPERDASLHRLDPLPSIPMPR